MGSTFSEVSLTDLFWKLWNAFEESHLFIFLRFVWNSCPSFISYHPFLSLPLLHPSTRLLSHVNPEGSSRKYHSHQPYHHHQDRSHMVSTATRGEAAALCTPRGQRGNSTPLALHSPSLRWAQPARSKNFYTPGFSRASNHALSISLAVFQQQQESEVWKAFKNVFHVIPCLQNSCSDLPLSSCPL